MSARSRGTDAIEQVIFLDLRDDYVPYQLGTVVGAEEFGPVLDRPSVVETRAPATDEIACLFCSPTEYLVQRWTIVDGELAVIDEQTIDIPLAEPLKPGDQCTPGDHRDCVDPDRDGVGEYLIDGGDGIEALAPYVESCFDLNGDGVAGYPDSRRGWLSCRPSLEVERRPSRCDHVRRALRMSGRRRIFR
jgi:hypothetical protein